MKEIDTVERKANISTQLRSSLENELALRALNEKESELVKLVQD